MEDKQLSAGGRDYLLNLLPALRRLDALLAQAITTLSATQTVPQTADPFRGLYITHEETEQLLAREPGAPMLWSNAAQAPALPDPPAERSRLAWLQAAYELDPFEVDLLLLALAPELDRRYERLYAYLQDHVSRRRPSVDLALNLLCPDAAARLERRTHFDPHAPLIHHQLLHLLPEPDQTHPSLLAHTLKLDEQIVRFLLHQDGLDARLAPFCRLVFAAVSLEVLPLAAELKAALPVLIRQARAENRPLRLYFHGPQGVGKRQLAAILATGVGVPLLVVNLPQAFATGVDLVSTLRLILRYSWFENVIPYLEDLDSLRSENSQPLLGQLLDLLVEAGGVAILAGTQSSSPAGRSPTGVVNIPIPFPSVTQRREYWKTQLANGGVTLRKADLEKLAGRFRLTPQQIAEAATSALNQAERRNATQARHKATRFPARPTIAELFAAARAQTGHDLAGLARKITPLYRWDDIILPPDTLAQFREMMHWVEYRHKVLDEWRFANKLSRGKGVNALFAGPSGTGKTMAAEIIAHELGLDLYQIDLSGVVSKYIGETEKNLDRIFRAAESANAILFFDEADALFGKRSAVRDSHDRYANIEISYLLQKMEEYDGLSILATNLRQNLDEAFIRRLAYTIYFPYPDEADRRRIWAGIWPAEIPLAADVDLDDLAQRFRLTGGNIKNVALAAAFFAAADEGEVTAAHLLLGIRREFQKMGKALSEAELSGVAPQSNGRVT